TVAVGLEPGERLGGEARLVDAESGDDDVRVGTAERGAHHVVDDAGAGVGEHDGVELGRDVGDLLVVRVVEGHGNLRVGLRGEHVQARRIAGDDVGDDLEAGDALTGADEVAHGAAVVAGDAI